MDLNNMYLRVSRCEAVCNQLRSEMDDVLKACYMQACADEDEEVAAASARKLRNKMLAETDSRCTLDRVMPAAPEGSTFTSWLSWLRQLAAIRSNAWSVYRQHLRDIPSQPGFPFNIDWGTPPED